MPKDIEKILRGCFHPKEGKPNLRKVPVDMARTRQHIDKAHRNLRAILMWLRKNKLWELQHFFLRIMI